MILIIQKINMEIYPQKYTKEDFLVYLEKINAKDIIITKFLELPELIVRSGNTFKLDITTVWYDEDETYYNFELNYYSEELVEYLFNSKVFRDVESSINYLLCELMSKNYIKNIGCY